MKLRVPTLLLTLFLILPSTVAAGEKEMRGLALGTFHSYKGFGLSSSLHGIHSFVLYADTEGIFSGRTITPGFRFTYLYHCSLGEVQVKDGNVFHFYAGPGITTGYIRESVEYGWMGGVAVCLGTQVLLRKHFQLSLEFEGNVGFFFTENSKRKTRLKFYNNGLRYAIYPQLRIEYNF